jgi:CHAT domain-containing protein/tetratricopeptide (TPR) repeat protein
VLSIRQRILPSDSLGGAEILFNLGELKIAENYPSSLEEARTFHERALAMRRRVLGSEHPDIARSIGRLGECRRRAKDFAAADSLLRQCTAILENHRESAYPDLAMAYHGLAIIASRTGKSREAEGFLREELAVTERHLGTDDPELAEILANIARVCERNRKDLEEIAPLYERAIGIVENAYTPDHEMVSKYTYELGKFYTGRDRLEEGITWLKRTLEIRRSQPEPKAADIAACLDKLAITLTEQGEYRSGEVYAREAVGLMENKGKRREVDAALYRFTLATICQEQRKHDEALEIYGRAEVVLSKRSASRESLIFARCLRNRAGILEDQGRYAESEGVYLESLSILNERDGWEIDAAKCLQNLGTLYHEQGRYDEAEDCYKRAKGVREAAGRENESEYATVLHNLGALYADQGRFDEAEPLYVGALELRREILDAGHPDLATSLQCLGHLCRNQKRYRKAISYYKTAVDMLKAKFGPDHPDLAESMDGLGTTCLEQGDLAGAKRWFEEALRIRENALGENHPKTAYLLEAYSRYWRLEGDLRQALEAARRSFEIRRRNFCENGPFLPERSALNYSSHMSQSAGNYFSCWLDLLRSEAEDSGDIAGAVLACKGPVSDIVFEGRRSIAVEEDSCVQKSANRLRCVKHELSKLVVSGLGEMKVDSYRRLEDSLSVLALEIEKELMRNSITFREGYESRDFSVERLISCIPDTAVVIEYVRYGYVDPQTGTLTARYLAAVAKSNGEADVIDIGSASYIDSLVADYRSHMLAVAGSEHLPTSSDKDQYNTIAHKIFEAVLSPLDEFTSRAELLLVAPDGGLNLVSFAGLIGEDGVYLIERCPVHYLSAARDLIRFQREDPPGGGLLALGDPDYNATPGERISGKKGIASLGADSRPSSTSNRGLNEGDVLNTKVSALPHTRDEVELISQIWQASTSEPCASLLGVQASEDNFKAAAPGKRVIHVATHGRYLGAGEGWGNRRVFDPNRRFAGTNPLLRSWLFLAGSNLYGRGAGSAGCEDGILTAYEVSSMNLAGTDLVVLSACETGLGDVEQGEGVYGLRRAFQVAGVRTVVSALWQVPDKTTGGMMEKMYVTSGPSIPERVRAMQLSEIERLKAGERTEHPYDWAAFVVTGDWE